MGRRRRGSGKLTAIQVQCLARCSRECVSATIHTFFICCCWIPLLQALQLPLIDSQARGGRGAPHVCAGALHFSTLLHNPVAFHGRIDRTFSKQWNAL
jgi:hypothetical protein